MLTRSILVGAVGFLAATTTAIAAASTPVRLEWVAPASCPSRADMLADIARTAGDVASSFVVARIVVTENGASFHADVVLTATGSTTTRTLEADTCRAVATAAALIVALAVNADASPVGPSSSPGVPTPTESTGGPPSAAQASALAPAPAPKTEPGTSERPTAAGEAAPKKASSPTPDEPVNSSPPPERSTPARESAPHGLSLATSFALDTSLLPSTAYGAEASVGWSLGRLDLAFTGLLLGARRATLPTNSAQGANLSLAQIGARACYSAASRALRVGPCGGIGFVWTIARGFGPTNDQPSDATGQTFVAELGGFGALRLLPPLDLELHAAAVLPFSHPTFVIDGGGNVFQTPTASFRATLGVAAHF